MRFAGLWFHQGESDAIDGHGHQYYDRLSTWVSDLRLTFDQPDLPIYVARLMDRYVEPGNGWDLVRNAQAQVGAEDRYTYVIEMDLAPEDLENAFHYTQAGYDTIADYLAETFAETTRDDWPTCGTHFFETSKCVRATYEFGCSYGEAHLEVEMTTKAVDTTLVDVSADALDVVDPVQVLPVQSIESVSSGQPTIAQIGPLPTGARAVVALSASSLTAPIAPAEAPIDRAELPTPTCPFLSGDVDGSLVVDEADILISLQSLAGLAEPARPDQGDLDRDGELSLSDVLYLARCIEAGDACSSSTS